MNFAEHVKIRNEKFGTVIFETLTEKIFVTNETGGRILQLIEQGRDAPQIIDELQNAYEDNQEIGKDITNFIDGLKQNDFIAKE